VKLMKIIDVYGVRHYVAKEDWELGRTLTALRNREGIRKSHLDKHGKRPGSYAIHRENVAEISFSHEVDRDDFSQVVIATPSAEPFQLKNDPPPARRCENDDRRQTVLFSGLDCLPGQDDLFPTE
jgi:hypothetical protein